MSASQRASIALTICIAFALLLFALLVLPTRGLVRIEEIDVLPGESGYRVVWASETGALYRVERTTDLVASNWVDIVDESIPATGSLTHFEDPREPGRDAASYRVLRLGGSDEEAPTVGSLSARLVDVDGSLFVEVLIDAQDNVGVTGVSVFDGETALGEAQQAPDGGWFFLIPFDPDAVDPLHLSAEARDGAGNTGLSGAFVLRVTQPYPPGMRPLSGGAPAPRLLLGEREDGQLQPFTYIPDNHAGGSFSRALRFDFFEGARLIESNGVQLIRFNAAFVHFGANSPLRFVPPAQGTPPVSGDSPFDDIPGYLLNFPLEEAAELIVGELDVESLKELLGIPPVEDIPLMLFDIFPMDWVDGILTEAGIIAGRFRLPDLGFPLPELTGDYAEALYDLFSGKSANFPIVGEWDLPGTDAKLKSSRAKPLTLTLKPSGRIALRGPVEIVFSDDFKLTATLRLDDPVYSLTLESDAITVPLITLLGAILPDDPEICVGAGFDDAQLDAMRECVRAHDRAYRAFIQAALALRPDTPADDLLGAPPGVQELVGPALEAAGATIGVLAGSDSGLPIQAVRDFVNRWWAPSVAEPDDLLAAVENLLASDRYRVNLETALAGDPDDPDIQAALAEVDAVIAEARTALLQIALSEAATSSLERMNSVMKVLADFRAASVTNEVQLAALHVLTTYVGKLADEYSIEADVFTHVGNAALEGMRYETALELMASLQDAIAFGQVHGFDQGDIPLYYELIAQTLNAAASRIFARLDESIPSGDLFPALLAVGDLATLLQATLPIDSVILEHLPDLQVVTTYLAEIDAIVFASLVDEGPPLTELFRISSLIDETFRVLDGLDTNSFFSVAPRIRLHTMLSDQLPGAVFAANQGEIDRVMVLRAGFAHARIGRTVPGALQNYFFETGGLEDLTGAWTHDIATSRGWADLHTLLELLYDEAAQLEREAEKLLAAGNTAAAGERAISRKRYLRIAAEVLTAVRPAILDFWAETQLLRAAASDKELADGALPGDLQIDRLRGSIEYNRQTETLSGSFKGRLVFPAEDLFVEIVNASVNSTGTFNIHAATQIPLEPFGNPNIRLTGTIQASGTSGTLTSLGGTGEMAVEVPNTGGEGVTTQLFTVAYSYAPNQPGKPLKIESEAQTEEAPLAFAKDFVLFNFAWGAEWRQGAAGGFQLKAGGLAGLYERKPLSVPVDRTNDFWAIIEINDLKLESDANKLRAEFNGGELELPADIFVATDELGESLTNQRTRVTMAGSLAVDIPYTNPVPSFSNATASNEPFAVTFENFRFPVPGMPDSRITVGIAELHFFHTNFPVFHELHAELRFPLPGMNAALTNQNRMLALDIAGEDWRVDGFPKLASLKLVQSLEIVQLDGLTLVLLSEGEDTLCGTEFKIERVEVENEDDRAKLTLEGGMKAVFKEELMVSADEPGVALESATVCGSFVWDFVDAPNFNLPIIQIVGRANLGGPDGLRIVGPDGTGGATLTLNGLLNVFNLSTANVFRVDFTGAFDIADFITFALSDAGLTWDGSSLAPQVSLGGVRTEMGSELVELADSFLPVFPTELGLEFFNSTLPLFPPAGGDTGGDPPAGDGPATLLDPLNIRFRLSGVANLPSGAAIAAGAPGISGFVDGLTIGLRRQGNLFLPDLALEGLRLEVSNLDLPPLGGLGGGLYVGNLHDPENLFFAGTLKGEAYEAGVTVSMAIHRQLGLLGVAFDVDAGPAGIPVDGGALGGILLTGGGGGLSFGNRFQQPTHFLDLFQLVEVNGEKRPVNDGNTATFDPTGAPPPIDYGNVPPQHGEPGCIRGEFPPPTINPLAEEHPTIPDRIIFKGTALSEAQVNALGITPASLPTSLNEAVEFAVGGITQPVRDIVGDLAAGVSALVPSNTVAFYVGILDRALSQAEETARNVIAGALGAAVALDPDTSLYDAVVDAAAAGIPALDVTLRVQGNFSHAAVSTVMKGKGAITVSTTGTATMDGEVTMMGLPVGKGILAFSLTDSQGDINPSFGGVLEAGLGPLALGNMSMAYDCDGCVDGVLSAFDTFFAANVAQFNSDTRVFLIQVMNRAVPSNPPRSTSGDPLALFQLMEPGQQFAFISALFNIVELAAEGVTIPGLSPAAIATFGGSFGQFIADVLIAVNPRFCFEAKIQPSLFGFPLVPGPIPLDASFAYERISDGGEFQQLAINTEFSPSFMLAHAVFGPGGALLPASDKVTFGYSFRVPAFTPETASFAATNPVDFAASQFSAFLQDSVMTFGYAFMPLGIPLADGQMRVIVPRLLNHPTNTDRFINPLYPTGPLKKWLPPSGPGIATQDDVILAALVRNRLSDATWRGGPGDLADLFVFQTPPAPGSPAARIAAIGQNLDLAVMDQLDFAADYFPYGGFIGAAQLEFPSVFLQAPPFEQFGRVLFPDFNNLGEWVEDVQDLFDNYITASSEIGQMALYLPAPNPPFGFNFSEATGQDLLQAVSDADVLSIFNQAAPQGLYAFDAIILAGHMQAQILGLPLGEATIRLDGPSGTFLANAGVPTNSWLSNFVTGSVEIAISKPAFMNDVPPPATSITGMFANAFVGSVDDRLADLGNSVSTYSTNSPPPFSTVSDTVQLLADTLPKVRMEAGAGIELPEGLEGFMRGGAAASVFAFSPAFDPQYEPGNFSPYALARRRGGVGFRGAFEFGFFPADVPTNQHFIIDIPDASFFVGLDGDVGLFPAFAGQLEINEIQLPSGPIFTNGLLNVSSSPDNLGPYLIVEGTIQPFDFTLPGNVDLMRIRSLNGDPALSGSLGVFRNDAVSFGLSVGLEISPSSLEFPFLGPGVAVTMHGGVSNSVFQPFSFSTTPGQAWSAQMALSAPGNPNLPPVFSISDPFATDGAMLMTFSPAGPLTGAISGVGTESFRADFEVPTGFELVFFPDSEHEARVEAPEGKSIQFIFDSDGRLYVDLGSLTDIELPGVISASARIEFGYNPDDPKPEVSLRKNDSPFSGPLTFGSINLVNTGANDLQVVNTGSQAANVTLSIIQSGTLSDFTVANDGFQIEPGGSRTVTVLFRPKAPGARSATLQVRSNDPVTPQRNITLSGTGLAEPIYVQTRPQVPFGDTLVGATSESTLTIGNAGSANMVVTSVAVSGAPFTFTPAGSFTLTPGSSRNFTVRFTPTALGPASGTLTLNINAPIGNKTIPLTGNGSESRWVTVLNAETTGRDAQINDLRMLDAAEGFAVGNQGTFLHTRDSGRSWTPRLITTRSLNVIAMDTGALNRPAIGIYHFDEPPGSLRLADTSGNNRHGTIPSDPTQRPVQSTVEGRFGGGLRFDGVDDFAQLGVWPMPASFSISLWAKFLSTANDQALITKNSTTGGSQFRFGRYNNGYQVRLAGVNVTTPGTPPFGEWVHFIVTGDFNPSVTTTTVRIYLNNSLIGTHTINGQVSNSASNPWMIGARMNTSTTRTDFLNGAMDEVMIFDGVLSFAERTTLFRVNQNRMVVAGALGEVYESYNRGRMWGQLKDLNVAGWRNRDKVYRLHTWNDAAFSPGGPGSALYLAGHSQVSAFGSFSRLIMREQLHPGADGTANTADDEFDALGFSGAPSFLNPTMTGVRQFGGQVLAVSSDGVRYAQNSTGDGPGSDFIAQTASGQPALNALESHGFFNGHIAVGDSGRIEPTPSGMPAVAATLRGVRYRDDVFPHYHVVGDNGTYLTSDNQGVNWTLVQDGLTGNMRAIDVMRVPGAAATNYHVWAAGENQTIQYRPPEPVSGSFMSFYPGKLDFGFVLANDSRTLPIRIANKGKQPLQISSLVFSGPNANRFSLGQSSLGVLPTEGVTTLNIRYRPTAASTLDFAELLVTCKDPAQSVFRIPLEGRSGTRDWIPATLLDGGQPFDGEVLRIRFTSTIRGYALVQPATGPSVLYRTNNGGQTWTRSALPASGGVPKMTGLAFVRVPGQNQDVGFLGGHVEDASGNFIKGLVLRTTLDTASNPAGVLWTDVTPIPSGQSTQPLRVRDVAALAINNTPTDVRVAVSTTGNLSTAQVWDSFSSGSSWFTPANRPVNFNGGPLGIAIFGDTPIIAADGARVFEREFAFNWPASPQVVQAQGVVRAMHFHRGFSPIFQKGWVVGDGGAFLMWDPSRAAEGGPGRWFPAEDAELFGLTDLRDIHSGNLFDVWVVGESKIFDSADQGRTWKLQYDAGTAADLKAVSAIDGDFAWVGGSLDGKATIWRYVPPPPPSLQVLQTVDYRNWGNVNPGASVAQSITLSNQGTNTLLLHDLRIETDEPRSRFRIAGTPPASIGPNSSQNVSVVFDAAPEASLAEELKPEFFLRFEEEWGSLLYMDDSGNGNHADLTSQSTNSRPTPALSPFRDRCLQFNGSQFLNINQQGPNLLQNPGNDEEMVGGEIPGWTKVIGANWGQRFGNPPPHAGPAYFFAGAGPLAELAQDVDVSHMADEIDGPRVRFRFRGYVSTFGDGDSSRIIVEYRNAANDAVLGSFDSNVRTPNKVWEEITDSRLAPIGTRSIRVRLIATRASGTNNDGYFDTLSLYAEPALNTLPSQYAVSLWAAPDAVTGTRVMLAKDTSSGGDRFKFSMTASGYQVKVRASTITGGGPPPLRWQHLAVNLEEPGNGTTLVSVYRDGALLFTGTVNNVLGNAAGYPWVIGAEYIAAGNNTANRFAGALDDVALFSRNLTEGEIQRLASKSPLYGEHRSRLVINSGSENGTREVALRALVAPQPRFIRIRTEPEGLPVTVDGRTYTSPVGFAVVPFASSESGAREWVEGSVHRISVPESVAQAHPLGSVLYRFSDWTNAPTREFTLTASRDMPLTYTATFVPAIIEAPPVPPPPPREPGPDPLVSGLEGAPKGPFLRITEGSLQLPNLGGNAFEISGELFLSLSRINGQLSSTALRFPATGPDPVVEIGDSSWRIEAEAGGPFLLEARPPSLAIIGYDVLPDGLALLSFTPESGGDPGEWALLFQLRRDFKPVPDMIEFKKGQVELSWFAVSGTPAFVFDLDGGIRILKLPNNQFAFNEDVRVRFDTVNFNVSINSLLDDAGIPRPNNVFHADPFRIGWSDIELHRVNGGPVFLELASTPFFFNNEQIVAVSGSLNTVGQLLINGEIGQNGFVRIDPNGGLFLRKVGTGSATFGLELSPRRLALETPPLRLESTAGGGDALPGVNVPGIRFDSAGVFDTGKLPLPAMNFDGINVEGPSGGARDKNHLRLRRDSTGKVTFTIKSEQVFLECRQELVFNIESSTSGLPTVTGAFSGNFCVLPEPISLRYNSGSSCQFSGQAFGFNIVFGSTCAGVSW